MRAIIIPNMEYDQYSEIFDIIAKNMPYVLVNQFYRAKLKLGVFNFWDESYIPKSLQRFIKRPPHENLEEMSAAIEKYLN